MEGAIPECANDATSPWCPCTMQRISFAKTKSDAVAKLDGTFKADKKARSAKNTASRGGSMLMSACKQLAVYLLAGIVQGHGQAPCVPANEACNLCLRSQQRRATHCSKMRVCVCVRLEWRVSDGCPVHALSCAQMRCCAGQGAQHQRQQHQHRQP